MPLTARAKRRFSILVIFAVGSGILLGGAWVARQVMKERQATQARSIGIKALENRDWEKALPNLSKAVVADPTDLAAIRGLTEARRRVPEANEQHLRSSLKFANRAIDVAKQNKVAEAELVETLLECARIELRVGAALDLEETCREIVGIDPSNAEAVEILFQIRRMRGMFIPDRIALTRKAGRTDREWLSGLREARDESALRWALERLAIENSLARRESVLGVLRDGRSEEQQRLREGTPGESTLDVAVAWRQGDLEADPQADLLVAIELLRQGEIDAARDAMDTAESANMDDADLLLRAVALREVLKTNEDQRRAGELLRRAEEIGIVSPQAAAQIAIRHWSVGRLGQAASVMESGYRENPDSLVLVLNGLLLSMMIDSMDAEIWQDRARILMDEAILEARDQETLGVVDTMATIGAQPVVRPAMLEELSVNSDSLMLQGNPIALTALGDLQSRAGLLGYATASWQRASDALNGASIEVARRLVSGYIRNQATASAFRESLRLASGTRSAASVQLLCRAWIALERANIRAQDIQSDFTAWESPRELAAAAYAELLEKDRPTSAALMLLAEAISLEQDTESLMEVTREGLDSGVDVQSVCRLARLNLALDTEMVPELLGLLSDADLDAEDARTRMRLELDYLRSQGRFAEAEAQADRDIPLYWSDDPDAIDRIRCQESMKNRMGQGTLDENLLTRCLQYEMAPEQLTLLFRDALERGREGSAETILGVAIERFGPRSPIAGLLGAEFVLAFGVDDPVAVDQAILVADELITGGASDVDLQIALARLLRVGPRPAFDRAIQVLRDSVVLRPGRFDITLMLVDLLQETGRFDEASEYLQQIRRREAEASPQARRLLGALLAMQGDMGGLVENACEIANETDDVFDKLQCIRALFLSGRETEADHELGLLVEDPTRPVAVDRALARRLASLGRIEEAMETIENAPGHESPADRLFDVAETARRLRLWDRGDAALLELESIDPGDRATMMLRAEYELSKDDGDVVLAAAMLDGVESDPEVTVMDLRKAAILRLPERSLRAGVPSVIDKLRVERPLDAAFIELTLDSSDDDGAFKPSQALRERAAMLVRDPMANAAVWMLAIQLEQAAFDESMAQGDVMRSSIIADGMRSLLEQATSRFVTDNRFPRLLSLLMVRLGDYEDAMLAAQEALRRSRKDNRSIGDSLLLARIHAFRNDYPAVLSVLEPFAERIEDDPATFTQAASVLMASRIVAGQLDDAWRLLLSLATERGPRDAGGMWLSALSEAEDEVLVNGYRRLVDDARFSDIFILSATDFLARVIRSESAAVALLSDEVVERARARSGTVAQKIQLSAIVDGIRSKTEPGVALRSLGDAIDAVPVELFERMERFDSLEESEQREIAALRYVTGLAMNNYVAIWAKNSIDAGGDGAGFERADEYARRLAILGGGSADVLDSLAFHALAKGEVSNAGEFAENAVDLAPARPQPWFMLARVQQAGGDVDLARESARKALILARRSPAKYADLIDRVTRFLDVL